MPDQEAEVLIVDDETDLCWALAHVLKRSGINSVWVNTGDEALASARAHCFRLVFVDAKLPDLDGIELARRLRENNERVCIVLISGYFYRDDIEVHRAIATGLINGFISKPFLHDEVRSVATRALA